MPLHLVIHGDFLLLSNVAHRKQFGLFQLGFTDSKSHIDPALNALLSARSRRHRNIHSASSFSLDWFIICIV